VESGQPICPGRSGHHLRIVVRRPVNIGLFLSFSFLIVAR
jgi:hypothetical protein